MKPLAVMNFTVTICERVIPRETLLFKGDFPGIPDNNRQRPVRRPQHPLRRVFATFHYRHTLK